MVVLFIDEAYGLGKGPFGEEALETLVEAMTKPKYRGCAIIIAGYPREIDAMFDLNGGLKSRFTRYVNFQDWTEADAVSFIRDNARKNNLLLSPEAELILTTAFSKRKTFEGFANGRDADTMLKQLVECRAQRVVPSGELERTIIADDATEASQTMIVAPSSCCSDIHSVLYV